MTAPTIQSIQHNGLALYIIFDRDISNVANLTAFTFEINPGATVVTPTFTAIQGTAITATLATPVGVGETLSGSYTDPGAGVSQVLEAAAPNDPATSFADEDAIAYYTQPLVRRAEVAAAGVNDAITIFFSEPVSAGDGDLLNGFTVSYDGEDVPLTAAVATLNADLTELTIATGSDAAYSAVVVVEYTGGDLTSYPTGAVADFSLTAVNRSTDGLPNSSYPLSYVVKKALSLANNIVTAQLDVTLSVVDVTLSGKYGPLTVYTGGTFGVTIDNPDGITVVGGTPTIVSGSRITQTFSFAGHVKYATDAAADWQTTVTQRLAIELGKLRAADQGITFAADTLEAV